MVHRSETDSLLGLCTLRLFVLGVFDQGLQLLLLREHFEEVEQEGHKVVTTTRILELDTRGVSEWRGYEVVCVYVPCSAGPCSPQ